MTTEAEAKDKWCPFARTYEQAGSDGNPVSVNRAAMSSGIMPDCRCLASACMAWRWIESRVGEGGYCGLAGRPE